MKTRNRLIDSVDNLTKLVSELTEENKALQQELKRLMAGLNDNEASYDARRKVA